MTKIVVMYTLHRTSNIKHTHKETVINIKLQFEKPISSAVAIAEITKRFVIVITLDSEHYIINQELQPRYLTTDVNHDLQPRTSTTLLNHAPQP